MSKEKYITVAFFRKKNNQSLPNKISLHFVGYLESKQQLQMYVSKGLSYFKKRNSGVKIKRYQLSISEGGEAKQLAIFFTCEQPLKAAYKEQLRQELIYAFKQAEQKKYDLAGEIKKEIQSTISSEMRLLDDKFSSQAEIIHENRQQVVKEQQELEENIIHEMRRMDAEITNELSRLGNGQEQLIKTNQYLQTTIAEKLRAVDRKFEHSFEKLRENQKKLASSNRRSFRGIKESLAASEGKIDQSISRIMTNQSVVNEENRLLKAKLHEEVNRIENKLEAGFSDLKLGQKRLRKENRELKNILDITINSLETKIEQKLSELSEYRKLLINENQKLQQSLVTEIKNVDAGFAKKFDALQLHRQQLENEQQKLQQLISEAVDKVTNQQEESSLQAKIALEAALDTEINVLDQKLKNALKKISSQHQELIEEKKVLQNVLLKEIQMIDQKAVQELETIQTSLSELSTAKTELEQLIEKSLSRDREKIKKNFATVGQAMQKLSYFQQKTNEAVFHLEEIVTKNLENTNKRSEEFIDQEDVKAAVQLNDKIEKQELIKHPLLEGLDYNAIDFEAFLSEERKNGVFSNNPQVEGQINQLYNETNRAFRKLDKKKRAFPKIISKGDYRRYLREIEVCEFQWVTISINSLFVAEKYQLNNLKGRMEELTRFMKELKYRSRKIPFTSSKLLLPRRLWEEMLAYHILSQYLELIAKVTKP